VRSLSKPSKSKRLVRFERYPLPAAPKVDRWASPDGSGQRRVINAHPTRDLVRHAEGSGALACAIATRILIPALPGPRSGGGRSKPDKQGGPASPVEFRLDAASGVPTYLQLVHQVEHALRLGYLKPGDQLPKVRDVVASLAINPNTVLKAHRELDTKGLTVGRPGQRTFIEATLSQVTPSELTGLRQSLVGWVATADATGLDEDWIVALVTSALRDYYERRSGGGAVRSGAEFGEKAGALRWGSDGTHAT
jgi:GntR family transcriptional regulator